MLTSKKNDPQSFQTCLLNQLRDPSIALFCNTVRKLAFQLSYRQAKRITLNFDYKMLACRRGPVWETCRLGLSVSTSWFLDTSKSPR